MRYQDNRPPDTSQATLAAVEQLHRLGYAVVPTCRPLGAGGRCSAPWHPRPCDRIGKRPLLNYVSRPPTLRDVVEVSRRADMNLAIITRGLVALDADSPEAEAEVAALAGGEPFTTVTRERRPRRGRVWLFEAPPGVAFANRSHLGRSGAIDVRATSSGIVIVPPSIHECGHHYAWAEGRAPWETPLAPLPDALLDLATAGLDLGPNPDPDLDSAGQPGRLAFLLSAHGRLRELYDGRGKTGGDTSRSGYDHAVARELLAHRLRPAEVVAALAARPGAHRRDRSYLWATVRAASRRQGGRP